MEKEQRRCHLSIDPKSCEKGGKVEKGGEPFSPVESLPSRFFWSAASDRCSSWSSGFFSGAVSEEWTAEGEWGVWKVGREEEGAFGALGEKEEVAEEIDVEEKAEEEAENEEAEVEVGEEEGGAIEKGGKEDPREGEVGLNSWG